MVACLNDRGTGRVKVKASIFYFDDESVLLDIFREMFQGEYEG
jgi:hypothetical protein